MHRTSLLILITVFVLNAASQAQRKGALETGGSFSFKNIATADSGSQSHLNIEALIGYYLSRDVIIEIEPSIQFNSANDLSSTSIIFLSGLSFRFLDMAPYEYRLREYRKMDLGVTAGVYVSLGLGFWSDVLSSTNQTSATHSAGAIAAGLGTRSGFGKFTVLRTKAQVVYLLPSSAPYDMARTVFQIGIGFSVFVRT